jgi:hypothetical protein
LEYLVECAEKWHCVTWVDTEQTPPKIYFVDSAAAFVKGDDLALSGRKSIEDTSIKYTLGYKTDYARNNVARVGWKFGKPPTGQAGEKIAIRTDEKGNIVIPEDYVFDLPGFGTYQISPTFRKKAASNPRMYRDILSKANSGAIDASELKTEYWIKYPAGGNSKVNKDKQTLPDHASKGILLDIDLNKGDPYLRPPRQATLYCGSSNPKAVNSNLPQWLVPSGIEGLEININKVKTQLSDGMIKTSLEASV